MVVIALVMSVVVTWLLIVPLARAHKAFWIRLVSGLRRTISRH
jgi:hypothetical protein